MNIFARSPMVNNRNTTIPQANALFKSSFLLSIFSISSSMPYYTTFPRKGKYYRHTTYTQHNHGILYKNT